MSGLFLLSVSHAAAQSAADDSLLYRRAVYNVIALYHRAVGEQSGLYNGSQYAVFPFNFAEDGFPFFKNPKPGIGDVVYDGVLYEHVNIQYDEVQETLIMEDSTKRIQLLNPRVSAFTLFDNSFIRIVKDSTNKPLVRTGFYNVLYKGKISLLKREEKSVREDVTRDEVLRFIDVSRYYYIQKDGVWYSIKNRGSIAGIFQDHKKDVRQYIRKNKLNYKRDRDNMLIKVTAYYDQLTK